MPTLLDTPRLVLRRFTVADVDDLFRFNGDARVMGYLANGLASSRDEVAAGLERPQQHYIERPGSGSLHGRLKVDGRFVGTCGLFTVPEGDDIEIAYRGTEEHYGRPMQGYAADRRR